MAVDFQNLPRVVAVVGSREFKREDWVRKFVRQLKERTIVVSGGARGVDTWAYEEVKSLLEEGFLVFNKTFAVEGFEWELLGKNSGFARNETLVNYVKRHGGCVFVFANEAAEGKITNGSQDVIDACKKIGVPYTLFTVKV